MIRESIVEEINKILHGPLGGLGEVLDKNPLDFYSTGVLFPQLQQTNEYAAQDENSVGSAVVMQEREGDDVTAAYAGDDTITRTRRVNREREEGETTSELEQTTKFRPSAAGISVLISKGDPFEINIEFAVYKRFQAEKIDGEENEAGPVRLGKYRHCPFNYTLSSINDQLDLGAFEHEVLGNMILIKLHDQAQLVVTTRPYLGDIDKEKLEIKTFSLINTDIVANFARQKKAECCLFQPIIRVKTSTSFMPFEDRTDTETLSGEDLNLKLLYRNYCIYAQGHGISVNWSNEVGVVQEVYTQVLPIEQVTGVDLDPKIFAASTILYMKRLSGLSCGNDWEDTSQELSGFIALYAQWIKEQEDQLDATIRIHALRKRAALNLEQCRKLYERMKAGIGLLSSNLNARRAFQDANEAMFMQRVMGDFSKHRRKAGRVQQSDAACDDALPDYTSIPYDTGAGLLWKDGEVVPVSDHDPKAPQRALARWRPFQLAFLLSQVEGIIAPNSADRDTVDLIWFPTGGGKTEAYLGLTAFTIFYRRLEAQKIYSDPNRGAGVTVLMRYTLRLLNKQQFERATILICACDLIRRKEPSHYGTVRISNGIWMGRSMTPNEETDQITDYSDYKKRINGRNQPDPYKNSPVLLSCPCCGNRLVREVKNNQVIGRWGYFRKKNNRGKEDGRFLMACTNTQCDFYVAENDLAPNEDRFLPVYEVDQTIYNERPTLLFSTVDKFVQLAWKSDAFRLFNLEFTDNQIQRSYPSPELIIQDELHLISSSLGTIYGIYEIVVDRLCREANGNFPKIVGATATVRNAEEQCRRLYGRTHFLQFPPPATDADDSFYARKIENGKDPKNRLYLGFMPSGVTTSTALIRLTAVMLERVPALPFPNEVLDDYYTLVVYFNALKELGKFRTFLTDDIVAYRKLLANHFRTFFKPFNYGSLCELSSVMTADDITNGLDRLEKTTLPRNLDPANFLVNRLFETGIRTLSDFNSAKGPVWKDMLSSSFFDLAGLPFTGVENTDYKTFTEAVRKLMDGQPEPVQIAPATNMISVGVDIPRLNTMIVNGQPKTTAEYIQASSRVGREGPGLVLTFLAPTKNRDRSHYEQFKSYHQAYYYYVEASSVTPFSKPALEKVLPTVLVTLTRSLFLKGNDTVFNWSNDEFQNFLKQIITDIAGRAASIYDGEELTDIQTTLDEISQSFLELSGKLSGNRRLARYGDFIRYDSATGLMVTEVKAPQAYYNAPSQFVDTILHDHIPTMQTLRNVESSSRVRIKS